MSLPAAIRVSWRDIGAEALPEGGGVENFDTPAAQEINRARMEHLESLKLPLTGKSVLDVGCGVGHLAQFFVKRNCKVTCIDGREQNVRSLHERYPQLEACVANVEGDLTRFGTFDIVFCYGLLYHLENPISGLRNMAALASDLLLLETIVCDHSQPLVLYDDETKTYSQALSGVGCRPTPSFVAMMLSRVGFHYVYTPTYPPQYPDFQVEWTDSLVWRKDDHPIRCVFVASKRRLENANLISLVENPAVSRVQVPAPDPPMQTDLVESEIWVTAESLAYVRPLVPYPGWHFDIEWDNLDLAFQMRKKIWSYFRDRQLEAPFMLKWYHNLRLMLYLGNDLSKQLFIGGCYDPNEFAWLNTILAPGMVFLDVGANDGLYTIFAARKVGESGAVWAFEPSEREFQRLCHNVQWNELKQVRAFKLALSDYEGTAELKIAGSEHAGQNTLGDFIYQVPLLRKQCVEVRTLDGLIHEKGLTSIDVMKIDVEGSEQRVLEGASNVLRNIRPILVFEVADAALLRQGSSSEQLLDFLRSFGYTIFAFDKATGRPKQVLIDEFCSNLIAVPERRVLRDG